MKNKAFIVVLTIVVTILCIFYLSFSVISWNVKNDALAYATDQHSNIDTAKKERYLDSLWREEVVNIFGATFTLKEVRQQELKLGLDLQGGMHIVLEISPEDIIRNLSSDPKNEEINEALSLASQEKNSEEFVDLFIQVFEQRNPELDLARYFLSPAMKGEITASFTNKELGQVLKVKLEGAIDRSFKILRDRIDRYGVANPNIQLLPGTDRIQIELPGVEDPARVRKLVQGIAKLEFHEVYSVEEISPVISSVDEAWVRLNPNLTISINESTLAEELAESNEVSQQYVPDTVQTDRRSPVLDKLASGQALIYNVKDTAEINAVFNNPTIQRLLPAKLKFCWSVKPDITEEGEEFIELYPLKLSNRGLAVLDGDVISSARQDYDERGQPAISMQMNPYGAKQWQKITSEHIEERIAIVLDGMVYSAPVVQTEIPNGSSSISGNFTVEEAKDLANVLEAGKLPTTTNIVEEAIIGPSLGQDAIVQGLLSMAAGLSLVIVFMMLYYNSSGMVANLALFLNVFFIIGVLVQFGAALTLPGIAGIVLTIGMSVDANVLIFERIKEEILQGQTIKSAISTGYTKAYSSIVDSNITTFLIGMILYTFGSGSVKGFAVVLMIGIVCSMFTAVFITRLIIEWRIKKNGVVKFDTSFTRGLFNIPTYDFVGNRKRAYYFSGLIILIGIVSVLVKGGLPLGIDFKGGRSYVVEFEKPQAIGEIRTAMERVFPDASLEIKTYNGENKLKITTSYLINSESVDADVKVENALKAGLDQIDAGKTQILSSNKIGPAVADDLRVDSQTAIVYSLLIIFAYIVLRFRKWQFGLGAVIALFHDVLVVLSFFAIANLFGLHLEIDQVFIAAILTVIGYSINDTVVVFDRIREFSSAGVNLSKVFNKAINNTLSRTTITSFTVFIVVIILLIFGGDVLRGFSFALLIGVIFGTYSSIFIASPIVLDLDRRKERGKLRKIQDKKPIAA